LDRHLIEAVAAAARYARDVARPDLLSIGALLHDIGKGLPGDHSVVGVEVASGIAQAIGLPPDDVVAIGRLIRWHLLLPEVATRRDLGDPQTVRHVADAVGDLETLELLHALSRADAVATGPAAWSAWKERLVADLVMRVRAALVTGTVAPPPVSSVNTRFCSRVRCPRWRSRRTGSRWRPTGSAYSPPSPAARPCTGSMVSADTATATIDDAAVAVVSCRVQPRDASGPDRQRLASELTRAVNGELDVDSAWRRGSEHPATAGRHRTRGTTPASGLGRRPATDATILN
jgi:[protein-PII] uridylyltransferase